VLINELFIGLNQFLKVKATKKNGKERITGRNSNKKSSKTGFTD